MAHTPGPWRDNRGGVEGPRGEPVCAGLFNNTNGTTLEACHANMRLIAAAPDLLAACEAALTELQHLGQALGEMTPPETVDVWNQIEAAVQKAKGDA
jgi:hypothetical protein